MKYTLLKTTLILMIIGCCLNGVVGQTVKKSVRNNSKIDIKLSTEAFDKTVCSAGKIPFVIKLTNLDKKPIVIDILLVTRNIYVRTTKIAMNSDGKSGKVQQTDRSLTSPHFQVEPSYKVLQPKESYETQMSIDMSSHNISNADFLYIQTGYNDFHKGIYLGFPIFNGSEKSNKLVFDLSNCEVKN
jgi:hypothetical protein